MCWVVLGTDDLFLLAILNSRVAWFAISNISIPFGVRAGEFRYRLIYQYMEKLPIRVLTRSASDLAVSKRVADLVDSIITLHAQLGHARTDHERTAAERQIKATDRQIDKLVYELYGLTDDEIAIVESAMN
jgi:hypothetical protein